MSHKVCVYGSLREGLHNHALLHTAEFIDEYWTEAEFKMVSLGGFPALVPDSAGIQIKVELYEVDDNTFARLDSLEGYPSFYDRKIINLGDHEAWIYYQHEYSSDTIVDSGDWKEYYTAASFR